MGSFSGIFGGRNESRADSSLDLVVEVRVGHALGFLLLVELRVGQALRFFWRTM